MRNAIGGVRQIMCQPDMRGIAGDEILPGKDTKLGSYVIVNAESGYHPAVPAKSDPDTDAAVDPECRVIGMEGLRVAGASVFPQIPNDNLNATVIMVAERIADMIL